MLVETAVCKDHDKLCQPWLKQATCGGVRLAVDSCVGAGKQGHSLLLCVGLGPNSGQDDALRPDLRRCGFNVVALGTRSFSCRSAWTNQKNREG